MATRPERPLPVAAGRWPTTSSGGRPTSRSRPTATRPPAASRGGRRKHRTAVAVGAGRRQTAWSCWWSARSCWRQSRARGRPRAEAGRGGQQVPGQGPARAGRPRQQPARAKAHRPRAAGQAAKAVDDSSALKANPEVEGAVRSGDREHLFRPRSLPARSCPARAGCAVRGDVRRRPAPRSGSSPSTGSSGSSTRSAKASRRLRPRPGRGE